MLGALFPDQIKTRLAAELDIDDIGEQLHSLEVDEEELICALEAAGEFVTAVWISIQARSPFVSDRQACGMSLLGDRGQPGSEAGGGDKKQAG